jgi:hypothetical protein
LGNWISYHTKLEKLDRDKRSSLLCPIGSDENKELHNIATMTPSTNSFIRFRGSFRKSNKFSGEAEERHLIISSTSFKTLTSNFGSLANHNYLVYTSLKARSRASPKCSVFYSSQK